MFSKYVDKYYNLKAKAKNENNKLMSTQAKLMLNSLYGKFGSGIKNEMYQPYLGDNNIVKYRAFLGDDKKPVYQPVAIFVTSLVRKMLFDVYNRVGFENVVSSDTDSVVIIGDFPKDLISQNELGKWKNEVPEGISKFKTLGNKCYAYVTKEGKKVFTASGFKIDSAKESFEDFVIGVKYWVKQSKRVPSGILIENVEKELKERDGNIDMDDFL
jgi:hypothetical protein